MEQNHSDSSNLDDKTLVSGLDGQNDKAEVNLIGKCFKNRYFIECKIGSGGMSDIYRAKDLHLESVGIEDPYVAIKVLLQQFSFIPEAKQVLVQEARSTQQLSHPNIIRVYDVDSHANFHFIVMEWLDGETLEQIIKRSKPSGLSFTAVYKLIEQIGDALKYAHKAGIVHTDLKPSNIILTRKGDIKVFDFGVARNVELNVDQYALENKERSSPLNGFTPAYASFEQIKGEAPCAADDVYAFSCLIYELLSSKHPYQRLAADKVNINKTPLIKPANINAYLWPTLKKGLALKKAERSTGIDEILSKLDRKLWPKLAIGALASVAVIAAVQVYITVDTNITELNEKISSTNKENLEIRKLENMSSLTLLGRLDSFPEEHQLLKEGLVRANRSEIIDIIEKRTLVVPKGTNGVYKDYDKIELIITDALNTFPDSFRLLQLQNQLQVNRQITTDALSDRLHSLLSQGRYNEEGDNSVEKIINDLFFIDPAFKFQPKREAFNLFQRQFKQVINALNINKINELSEVGELAFKYHEDAKPLLDQAKEMKMSVDTLAHYNQQKAKGIIEDYPHASAEIFYRTTFVELEGKLAAVSNSAQLTKLDDQVMRLAAQIPTDFTPLIDFEKKLAASYLHFANVYMNKKYFNTAKKLIKRGNELYGMVN